MKTSRPPKPTLLGGVVIAAALALGAGSPATRPGAEPARGRVLVRPNQPLAELATTDPMDTAPAPKEPALEQEKGKGRTPALEPDQVLRTAQTVGLFALISLAPAAVLMVTAFVRINIVLILLRQALGSPQVPGNQVLTALAVLLTALVMRPVADTVYTRAIAPYRQGEATAEEAWRAGSRPIKAFMVRQIERTNHQEYLWTLYDYAEPRDANRPDPVIGEDFPLRVVAPAFLLSELTTALVIGFYLYLPFLVIDLVVSAVLTAMGLLMLPPALVALPLKLILFVLADGWLLVASMLLQSFGAAS
jgi:flagellar biosynthesis protein FliP